MSGTITGTITNTYTLSVNPTTVTKTGAVEVSGSEFTGEKDAIFGPSSTSWSVNNEGTVSSTAGYGVNLQAGGTITNAAGALIKGGGFAVYTGTGYYGHRYYNYFGAGVVIRGGAGTVVNAGTIEDTATNGYGGYIGAGIKLYDGGSITNAKGGVIGLESEPAAIVGYGTVGVTVTNSGTIDGLVNLEAGSVTNEAGGTIGFAEITTGTVVNAGSIDGVSLGGGYVSNAAGGVIAVDGVTIGPDGGTVVNGGSISENGIAFSFGHTYYTGAGVDLQGGGSVTNSAGGVISGGGPPANGIEAGGIGVEISGGAGTVVNAGTITGGSGEAVELAAGYANRVVVDPGAVFNGIVDGGNVIGGPVASTLELAAGGGGLLHNLNSQFVDFANVVVDSGADWEIANSPNIAVGQTLSDAGTLYHVGSLDVGGEIALDGGTFASEGLTIAAGGVVSGAGTISSVGSGPTTVPLAVAAGATLDAVGGTLVVGNQFYRSGTVTIAGALDGEAIDFAAGRTTLEKGVHATVGTIELTGNAALSLGSGLSGFTYPGEFDDSTARGHTQFLPHANNVTLSGSASFIGNPGTAEIVGTGSLTLAGPSHLGGVAIENHESLLDSGSLVQSGTVALDNSSSLRVTATGTWDITADTGIGLGSGATGSITNIGIFEKTSGTDTSVIGADFVNYGTIVASSGTLDFAGGFTNHGKIIQNGGTVIVGPVASPALFNQYAAGTEPDGVASTVAAAGPETQPPPTLAPPHAA